MIIPRFSIHQDHENVYVTIVVPYIRITNVECITSNNEFSFYCKPYLLKLTFLYSFQENSDQCKVIYDLRNHGTLVATLPKQNPGQYFPDLDLTTKLLQTNQRSIQLSKSSIIPSIEVLTNNESSDNIFDNDSGEKVSHILSSDIEHSSINIATSKSSCYGFNQSYSGIFQNLREELQDMLEIKEPEEMHSRYRRETRISCENILFNIERYIGDLSEGESDFIYKDAMSFEPFYIKQWNEKNTIKETSKNNTPSDISYSDMAFELIGGFTESEKQVLYTQLINKEYLIHPNSIEEKSIFLGLVDILFAYCYDLRITNGESTVESSHNIAKLSCCFSWLEDFSLSSNPHHHSKDIKDSICFTLRRSIIYPYLRVWKLSRKILADVAKILFLGKRAILKCLLHIKNIFEHTDTHYLLNKIMIDDYCIWIQDKYDQHKESLYSFAKEYNTIKGNIEKYPYQGKELMGFNLPELEQWLDSSEYLENNLTDDRGIIEIIPEHLLRYIDSQQQNIELVYLLPVPTIITHEVVYDSSIQSIIKESSLIPTISRLIDHTSIETTCDNQQPSKNVSLQNKKLIVDCDEIISDKASVTEANDDVETIITHKDCGDLLKPISTRRFNVIKSDHQTKENKMEYALTK